VISPGTYDKSGDSYALTFEADYAATVDDVFSYLTVPPLIERWLAKAAVTPRVGGVIGLLWPGMGVMAGEIDRIDPPEVFSYSWREARESHVTWTVQPKGPRAQLTLRHDGIAEEDAAGFGAGWQSHLEALSDVLAGANSTPEERTSRYHALRDTYEARLPTS
jgi:uncharacterized protein YndB with AHSA1/START domain